MGSTLCNFTCVSYFKKFNAPCLESSLSFMKYCQKSVQMVWICSSNPINMHECDYQFRSKTCTLIWFWRSLFTNCFKTFLWRKAGTKIEGIQDVYFVIKINASSKSLSWSAQGGGGPSCIKIGYSEPRGAESREGSSTLAESSRVT